MLLTDLLARCVGCRDSAAERVRVGHAATARVLRVACLSEPNLKLGHPPPPALPRWLPAHRALFQFERSAEPAAPPAAARAMLCSRRSFFLAGASAAPALSSRSASAQPPQRGDDENAKVESMCTECTCSDRRGCASSFDDRPKVLPRCFPGH